MQYRQEQVTFVNCGWFSCIHPSPGDDSTVYSLHTCWLRGVSCLDQKPAVIFNPPEALNILLTSLFDFLANSNPLHLVK